MKPSLTAPKRQFIDALQTQLIPWAGSGAPLALLDAPPKILGANRITETPGNALPPLQGIGKIVRVRHWLTENLNSASIPMFGCIVNGEADIVVGTTQATCRKLKIGGKRWIIEMPQRSFFLVPPEVPVSSGGHVFWHRAHPEKAYSRVLWIQIHESGVYWHFNTSDNGKLWLSPRLFLRSQHVFPLAQNLIQELQLQSPRHLPIAYYHLGLMLEYLLQSLLLPANVPAQTENFAEAPALLLPAHPHSVDERMQKILEYINENLAISELSAEQIATRFHLSTTHLQRLFHRELSTSAMKFVQNRRLEFAQQLLLESSFNIEQISHYCGYRYSSNFANLFMQHYGVSPSTFRNNARPDVSNS